MTRQKVEWEKIMSYRVSFLVFFSPCVELWGIEVLTRVCCSWDRILEVEGGDREVGDKDGGMS